MYFTDLLMPGSDVAGYEQLLSEWSTLLRDMVAVLAKSWHLVGVAGVTERRFHHATIQVLTRHVREATDGTSVLVARGCAEPCKPLLRTSFEAMLGIDYILEADEERRGLAYQVAHAHRKMSFYRKLDPTESAGKDLRNSLANDSLSTGVLFPQFDSKPLIANLEAMLRKPEYAPIAAEWAKQKKPAWHSLFDGPKTTRDLAFHLNHGGMY